MKTRRVALHKPVPADLRSDFLEKLAYAFERIASYELDASGEFVNVEVVADEDFDEAASRIDTLARKIVDRHRAAERVITFEHRVEPTHRKPIWDDLESRGSMRSSGPGLIVLAGESIRVALALDALFVRMVEERFDAEHHQYPSMLEFGALDRCGYFGSFPHHVTFAPHVRQDLDAINQFAAAEGRAEDKLREAVAPPTHVLSPAICFHTYLFFRDRPLDRQRAITSGGRCFRYEGRNLSSGERLWDYTIRELVFIGGKDWVETARERAMEWTRAFVEDMGLDAWMESANDPFFMNNFVAQRYFQRTSLTKIELRLGLPYSSSSLSASSFNLHNDFFGRSFGIAWNGAPAYTACVGYGIERWVWALHAQFGPSLAEWPREVIERLRL